MFTQTGCSVHANRLQCSCDWSIMRVLAVLHVWLTGDSSTCCDWLVMHVPNSTCLVDRNQQYLL